MLQRANIPRIYGAAKLSGQTRNGLSMGLMQAVTAEENARVRTSGGLESARLAEPLTSFSLLRLQQSFRGNASAGFMAASAITNGWGSALTGQTDLMMDVFHGDYKMGWVSFFSYLSEERYLWQDEFIQQGLKDKGPVGFGSRFELKKVGGEHWAGKWVANYYSPNLALNDVGYLERGDRAMLSMNIQHHRKRPWGPLAAYSVSAAGFVDRNTAGLNLGDGLRSELWLKFKNGWMFESWVFSDFPKCDDRETRTGGQVAYCGSAQRFRMGGWINSDQRLPVSAFAYFNMGTTEYGRSFEVSIESKLLTHTRLQLGLDPGYHRSQGRVRWIDTIESGGQKRFLFAQQHVESWNLTLRSTWTFSTELTLQAYAQLFFASVDYSQKYATPDNVGSRIDLDELVERSDIEDKYDFTSASLNISTVLRWEFQPGSVAYLVYTGAFGHRLAFPEFRVGAIADSMFDSPAQHVLMLKLSYLWGA
jgi:hypothetical protein